MHNFKFILFATQVVYLSVCVLAVISVQPAVKVENGIIKGATQIGSNGKEVYVFYGIPFAKPPIGHLRFRRPVPYTERWGAPFDATKLPNTCPQVVRVLFPDTNLEDSYNPNTNISEDCLYLNIWVPASQFLKTTNVYFWIYGGGFASGTSTLDMYNGANLAAEKDVIVVSTQYRVGAFGFFYLGTDDAPGNQGLIDQQFALEWVNYNIRAFGGDPGQITLFGESAGAASVSYHLLAPRSIHLFKRAVLISGVALGPWAYNSPEQMLEISKSVAGKAGCTCQNKNATIKSHSPSETINCLRHLSMDDILAADYGVIRTPTTDGYFIHDEPRKLLQRRDIKRTEILIGGVINEGTSLLLESHPKYFHHTHPTEVPYDGFQAILSELLEGYTEAENDAAVQFYSNWINTNDGFENQKILSELFGDYYLNCPVRSFADQWSARGLSVYSYFFTHRTESSPWGKWIGVRHTDDIAYFFGQPLGNSSYTKAEQDLSRKIMDLVADFARTGKPSESWERYSQEYPYYLDLNATVISDATSSLFGPRAEACAFWNVYLPQLRQNLKLRI